MTSPTPPAFATPQDVANTWQPITGTVAAYAGLLLDAAGILIRNAKAEAGQAVADGDYAAKVVSVDIVRERLKLDGFPAHSGSHVVDGRSDSWSGPRNATVEQVLTTLMLTDYHQRVLGLMPSKTRPVGQFGNALPPIDPIRLPAGGWQWPMGWCS